MAQETLEEWLRRRHPRIPGPFLPYILEEGTGFAGSSDLAIRGGDALEKALDLPGRTRESAFHLLVADAYITYACERVVQEEDLPAGLENLLEVLGDRFR